MRRRALLAASQPSGGIETTLQFPLYIYFDYCEDIGWAGTFCKVNGDFSELTRYLIECCKVYGEESANAYVISIDNISKVGEIYIEGEPIEFLSWYSLETSVSFTTSTYCGVIYDREINADSI